MKAILLKPGKFALAGDIDASYHSLRGLVGGHTKMTYPFPDEYIVVVTNEDAMVLDLAPNRARRDEFGRVRDIYRGPMVALALDDDGGFRSLTKREARMILREWSRPETRVDWGRRRA